MLFYPAGSGSEKLNGTASKKILCYLFIQKRLGIGHFFRLGSGSGPRLQDQDPEQTKKVWIRNTVKLGRLFELL
jgi:hypothetical protein